MTDNFHGFAYYAPQYLYDFIGGYVYRDLAKKNPYKALIGHSDRLDDYTRYVFTIGYDQFVKELQWEAP